MGASSVQTVAPETTRARARRPFDAFVRDLRERGRALRGLSREQLWHRLGPIVFLLALVTAYAVFYGLWSARKYHAFHAPAFDMAIFDQGVWLLSQFKEPFVTILGLNLFGDHAVFIMVFFVPLYWVWSTPETLLVVQSIALALGGFPVYLMARKVLRSRWLALVPTFGYLLYPALGWLNMENFHPDSLAVPLAFFALYFMTCQKWRRFLVMVGLLLLVKEDVWLFVVPLGVYVAVRHNLKVGLFTIAASVGWFLLTFLLIQPALSGVPPGSLDSWRIPYGGMGGLLKTMFTAPWDVIGHMMTAEKVKYLFQLMTPLLFLPLLDWRVLMAVPVLFFNLVSTFWYQSNIQYHYTSLLIPVLVVAAIFGLERFRKIKLRWTLAVIGMAVTVVCAYAWGPLPGSRTPSSYPDPNHESVVSAKSILELIPEDAAVAADDRFAAHMANRELIYIFPNPYSASYWGDGSLKGQRLPGAESVEYVMVTPSLLSEEGRRVYDELPSEGFVRLAEDGGVVLLRKPVLE